MHRPFSRAPYAQYLATDAESATKLEYIAGAIVAMAGGSVEHGRLVTAGTSSRTIGV